MRSAEDHPVTIVRSAADLVLLRRTIAADLMRASSTCLGLIKVCARLVRDQVQTDVDASFIHSLDFGDIATMSQELVDAFQPAGMAGDGVKRASVVLHEWSESSSWTANPGVAKQVQEAEAAYASGQSVPLSRPSTTDS